jgi:hypothetical protein
MRRWAVCIAVALGMALPLRAAAQDGAADPPVAAVRAPWSLKLSAGAGIGSRSLDLPMDGRIYQTRSGFFPAVELGFELDHNVSDAVSVGLLIRYQSSVGLRLIEHLTDGTEHPRATRSEQLQLAITPTWRLDSRGHWALAAALGYVPNRISSLQLTFWRDPTRASSCSCR